MDLNERIKALKESDLGFLLLQSDREDDLNLTLIDQLITNETIRQMQNFNMGLAGANDAAIIRFYPLMYHYCRKHQSMTNSAKVSELNYTTARGEAIYAVFQRWTDMGYNKHHAKDPFGCKAFMAYLDNIKWQEADYMLLSVV